MPRKGVDDVIRALTELPDTQLLVAGGPALAELDGDPEYGRLRRLAAELGVADQVVFVGRIAREELPALISTAALVVATPWYEPFGIVPLEAMACAVPVVASAVGGMLDTVSDGVDRRAGATSPAGSVGRGRSVIAAAAGSSPPARTQCASAGAAAVHLAGGGGRDRDQPARRRRRRTRAHSDGGNSMSEHLQALSSALRDFADAAPITEDWGSRLADVLCQGGKLLAAGNGGSAAQVQHLTAELVGRYRDDRPPFCAIALHSEPSALTAIMNDYGPDEVFARQLQAHGRRGDVVMLMSTSGASRNLLAAAQRARQAGDRGVGDDRAGAESAGVGGRSASLSVASPSSATVQELHLVALHMVCEAFDARVQQLHPSVAEVAS